jgi:RNA polymerase sigma-70 factor, ECF subfamily
MPFSDPVSRRLRHFFQNGCTILSAMPRPKDATAPAEPALANEQALADWMVSLYSELRRLACYYLKQERPNHTLQPTALVHEAYLRLAGQQEARWENRTQVMSIAAQMMRRILVDYSRSHESAKRGGKVNHVLLEEVSLPSAERATDVVVLDEALTRLAQLDAQHARIVELRYFGGLDIEETAEVLKISPATVKRNWNVAKAWLARELRGK